ncbi:MAG TPA: DNA ligase D, partial [Pricia sp.]|nr:DNA ligase D [Pricia sp.]
GKKICGRFALVKTGKRADKEQWLLIKKKDDYGTESDYDAEALVAPSQNRPKKQSKDIVPGKILQPMLASRADKIFNDPDWIYELKWDGYRVLAHISEKGVLLQSRNGINYNAKFRPLYDELKSVAHEAILDGEVVLLDEEGVPQFGELQNYPSTKGTLRYYVFDMLYLNGHSMVDLDLMDRKSLIPELIEDLTVARYCDHIEGMGAALFGKATEAGMEGVMAKEKHSKYAVGFRTEKWLKVKSVESEDALICGYTDSEDGGAAFGSLILGQLMEDGLQYIGNCGSGFTEAGRKELLERFEKHRTNESPFRKRPPLQGRKPNWMRPVLECEVKFSERTKNGLLRNPVFKGLRGEAQLVEPTKPVRQQPSYKRAKETIEVDGLSVPVSNLDKVFWPESGLTKYDLIDYYLRISDVIVPYLIDRPQSLHRHPDGIAEAGFYQKDNESVPEWMETVSIHSKSSQRDIDYLLCQNTASLLYMANLGCIEIHPWNSKIQTLDRPDYGIIDLDPPKDMGFEKVVHVALEFKKVLDAGGIKGLCKVSGSKGIHIYVPMGAQYTYEEVRNFIKLLCHFVEQRLPEIASLERRIKNREGKIYLDYLQNRRGHTIASVYSVRPLPKAPISAPIAWEELSDTLGPQQFSLKSFPKRLDRKGDLFAALSGNPVDMERALKNLDNFE